MNGDRVCWDFGVTVAPRRRRPRWWWVAAVWRDTWLWALVLLGLVLIGVGP